MKFKGNQGKLTIETIEEDFYVNIVSENGKSVAGISTNEEQFEEAIAYGKLFSAAPDLLELCLLVHNSFGGGNVITFNDNDIDNFKQAIEKALK